MINGQWNGSHSQTGDVPVSGESVQTTSSGMNGVDSHTPSSSMPNKTSSSMDVNDAALNAFDAFSGLGLAPTAISDSPNEEKNEDMNGSETHVAGNKAPSKFRVGQKVEYRDSQNNISTVEIISVHLDDHLEPFYTIKMPDGREKQTDDKHLCVSKNGVERNSNEIPVHESTTNLDSKPQQQDMHHLNSRINEISTMLKSLNDGQLATVHQFVKEICQSSN